MGRCWVAWVNLAVQDDLTTLERKRRRKAPEYSHAQDGESREGGGRRKENFCFESSFVFFSFFFLPPSFPQREGDAHTRDLGGKGMLGATKKKTFLKSSFCAPGG